MRVVTATVLAAVVLLSLLSSAAAAIKADFTRSTFESENGYGSLLHQQGRVSLDEDRDTDEAPDGDSQEASDLPYRYRCTLAQQGHIALEDRDTDDAAEVHHTCVMGQQGRVALE